MLTEPQVRMFSATLSQMEHSQRQTRKPVVSAGSQKSGLVGITGRRDGLDMEGFRVIGRREVLNGTNKKKPSTTQNSIRQKESASFTYSQKRERG